MDTIKKLEKQGYEGNDASLEISLFEYGFAYKFNKKTKEFTFIYGIKVDEDGEYTKFDWGSLKENCDVEKEFDWADFDSVANTGGYTKKDWFTFPLTIQVYDLLYYYGYENVFGTCYNGGFEIKK